MAVQQEQETAAIGFEHVFWNAPVGMSVANQFGQFLKVNAFFCELLGYSEPELLQRKISDITHQDDIALGMKERQEMLKNDASAFFNVEKRYVRKNGEVFWGQISLSILKNTAGQLRPYTLGVLKDISTQKAAEEKLLLSEHLFSSAFNHAGVGMALLDTQGRFFKVNPAFCRFLGCSEAQLKTIDFQRITYAEDLASDVLQFESLLAGDISSYTMHKRYIHASGEIRWGALSVSLSRRPDGSVEHVISQIQDIHAQKQTEAAYKVQAHLYEGLFASSFACMMLLSPEGIIQDLNLNAVSLLGGDKGDNVGLPLGQARCFSGLSAQQEQLNKMIREAADGASLAQTIKAVTPASAMILDFSLRPIKSRTGQVKYLVAEVRDMTHLREQQNSMLEQAEQINLKNKELQELTQIVSHDLQAPLRNILHWGKQLVEQAQLTRQEEDALTAVNQNAERMQLILRDLLAYARIGQSPQDIEWVSLNAVINQVVGALTLRLEATQARLKIGSLPTLQIVEGHAYRLFENLLSNALKFVSVHQTPEIEVSCILEGANYFQIEVKDNGIGFDSHFAEQIFNPFQRLQSNNAYHGNGIGLAMCRKIVAQYKGEIWAESAPGQGSRFFVQLPFKQGKDEAS